MFLINSLIQSSLNKQRKELEQNFFDFERRKFFKNRFIQLFGSIFRHRRRKEKLILVVGFYKFCLHTFIHGNPNQKSSISEKHSFMNPKDEKVGQNRNFLLKVKK